MQESCAEEPLPVDVPQPLGFQPCPGRWYAGPEVAQQPCHTIPGDLPDAEEAQYVVDPVGVEVLGHVGQASFPPGVVSASHFLPVIGGEPPILAVGVKVVRRCPCAVSHVELLGVEPGVHTLL